MKFLQQLQAAGAFGILRADTSRAAVEAGTVLAEEGLPILELTFTVPDASEAIATLRRRFPDVVVGAGTVTTPAEVADAVRAGAQFLVSPGCSSDLLASMASSGLPFVPGVCTPSEVLVAREAGATAFKLFPSGPLGLDYLKQLRGPFPDLAFVPTGGVQLDDVANFLRAGAVAVGLSSPLCTPSEIEERRWEVVRPRVAQLRKAVADARG